MSHSRFTLYTIRSEYDNRMELCSQLLVGLRAIGVSKRDLETVEEGGPAASV